MRPIFDTNIFGHVRDGSIPRRDWRYLLRHRPGRGWPLSAVTTLELLAGVHYVPNEKFLAVREQIELARAISKGRILEDPRFLLCDEVLHIRFPSELIPPSAYALGKRMEVVRRARSKAEILEHRVPYKESLTRGKIRAGFQTSLVNDLVAGPKKKWIEEVEALTSEIYPQWRELFQETGKRLPPEKRKEIESRSAWEPERVKFVESFLRWLGASVEPRTVAEITKKLDSVLEFTIDVAREFLIGNYVLEKHESDVYDQFQLHYLAMDRFIIVSEDANLSKRTARSSQVDRIMSFDRFLQSL